MGDDATYVVSSHSTGWSDESMRFGTEEEAQAFIDEQPEPWDYTYRKEA